MKKRLVNNYHTHTFRCGHAGGTDEEYVKAAIKAGIKELGFSDHIFYPGRPQDGIRQTEISSVDYINSIKALKEKYKKKIKIYVGYESEYQPSTHDLLKSLLDERVIDYLILGNHCFFDENNQYRWYCSYQNDKLHAKLYVDNTIEGMKSGLFKYVAHPDMILNGYHYQDEFITKEIMRLINASIIYNCPLEINLLGHLRHKPNDYNDEGYYPYSRFWELVGRLKAPVIIGIDAHMPCHFQSYPLDYALGLVKTYNLHLIEKIDIEK